MPASTALRVEYLYMPAARLGPENPLPPLRLPEARRSLRTDESVPGPVRERLGWGVDGRILPYGLQDGYGRDRRVRPFKVAVMENDVLRATFLLDYGGRLWSLYHKGLNRELLYSNPVFQPANLAVRNAWFSGGVEWNAGVYGHSPLTCSPVFADLVEGEGGSPVLRLYEWERVRGVPFQIDFILPPGSPWLFVRVRLVNPHGETIPMYWWSNIAVPEGEDVRVLAPAQAAYSFGYEGIVKRVNMPVAGGVDVSYATNVPRAADFFFDVPPGRRPWIAALDGHGRGIVQVSTGLLRGRKLFVWGMGPGGRRWQEFLSEPGHPYFEIQAGLARTQFECLPMPAGAEWTWMEAYGLVEADPARVHGPGWDDAVRAVEARLDSELTAARLEEFLARTGEAADRAPAELLHRGSGWGALERRRRERAGAPPFHPPALVFDDASLGEEQAPWLALLEQGSLPWSDPGDPPSSWMVQPEWRRMLEGALREGRGDHWLSRLHLGVMQYHAGEPEKARRSWEMSIDRTPSAWAYRNLAQLARDRGDLATAAELWHKAWEMAGTSASLAVEALAAQIEAGRPEEALRMLAEMPAEARSHGRVRVLEARALLGLGRLDEAEATILSGVEVPDLREGELTLTDLWYAIQERRIAKAENVMVDEALARRVRRELAPPPEIDFRMSAERRKAGAG